MVILSSPVYTDLTNIQPDEQNYIMSSYDQDVEMKDVEDEEDDEEAGEAGTDSEWEDEAPAGRYSGRTKKQDDDL